MFKLNKKQRIYKERSLNLKKKEFLTYVMNFLFLNAYIEIDSLDLEGGETKWKEE
jgi:hypothetical protein